MTPEWIAEWTRLPPREAADRLIEYFDGDDDRAYCFLLEIGWALDRMIEQ